MSENMFGWDLIYNASENDLKKKEDVIMLLVHFTLIKNGYRCVGLGDDKVLSGNEKSSELLPKEWNSSKNYSLRYVREKELYILRAVPVDDNLVFNLLKTSDLAVSNTAFNAESSVAALKGSLKDLVPDCDEVMKKIKGELIDPVTASAAVNKESSTQTTRNPRSPGSVDVPSPSVPQPDPLRPTIPNMGFPPGRNPEVNPFWVDPERDPLRVGRQDLDPFGRGGGMIFNPFDPRGGIPDPGAGIPGGLPRGSIPPGARFDPFGPPGTGRGPRRPPDTDFDPGYYM